eukprot:CAMPEP_0117656490 /NCGR_PEP_ID=MMETSP0804-20121206/4833_1 /TAXON_ID=1074897 /ORGANISM="Tetraselmis astigmatica, Strain CCMP880" /LENGTH=123 /DNA_ID=CAMNT_0005462897 /DNA_START=849 /DNA_END=1220 /DNA_ORIENTATION=-
MSLMISSGLQVITFVPITLDIGQDLETLKSSLGRVASSLSSTEETISAGSTWNSSKRSPQRAFKTSSAVGFDFTSRSLLSALQIHGVLDRRGATQGLTSFSCGLFCKGTTASSCLPRGDGPGP